MDRHVLVPSFFLFCSPLAFTASHAMLCVVMDTFAAHIFNTNGSTNGIGLTNDE